MRTSRHQAATLLLVLALVAAPARAQLAPLAGTGSSGVTAARPIAAAGLQAYKEGNYAEAVRRFEEADTLYPTPHYRIYIARAHQRLGKLASAARAYESATGMPPPPGAPPDFAAVQSTAAAELANLRPSIPAVSVEVTPAAASRAQVAIDGTPVGTAPIRRHEVDPGDHTITVTAPAMRPVSEPVTVAAGQVVRVSIVMQPEPPSEKRERPSKPRLLPGPGPATRDHATSTKDDVPPLSHRWRPGVTLRADIDPVHAGAVFAPGISFGVLDRLELVVSGLIGPQSGLEPGARMFLLTGAWKPLLEAAVPIFVLDGAHAGVRAAAGVQWDFHRHFGAFAQVGGGYFPGPPPGYESAYFLPSVGVQGRL